MKAAVQDRYGPPEVVRIAEVPKPVPGAGEILVRVLAGSVSSADARIRAARFPLGFGTMARLVFGLRGPRRRTLGTDLAGEVEAVGPDVSSVRPGDRIIALTGAGLGGHAEYRVLKATAAFAPMPPGLSAAEAAALPFGASTAVHFIHHKAALAAGERLLVIGAAGAVGTAAVQLGHARGAHVTGVARAENHDLLRGLGADAVLDYRTTDILALGQTWDVVLDMAGTARVSTHSRLLSPGGRLIFGVASLGETLRASLGRLDGGRRMIAGPSPETAALLAEVAHLASDGTLRPVIDRTFPLADVAQAHARVDTGHKRGAVILLIAPDAGAAA